MSVTSVTLLRRESDIDEVGNKRASPCVTFATIDNT